MQRSDVTGSAQRIQRNQLAAEVLLLDEETGIRLFHRRLIDLSATIDALRQTSFQLVRSCCVNC